MDRSLFLARLMGPPFVVIALGMLINLGKRTSTIVVALVCGTLGAFLSFKGYVQRA